jgi:hypothetical protein
VATVHERAVAGGRVRIRILVVVPEHMLKAS